MRLSWGLAGLLGLTFVVTTEANMSISGVVGDLNLPNVNGSWIMIHRCSASDIRVQAATGGAPVPDCSNALSTVTSHYFQLDLKTPYRLQTQVGASGGTGGMMFNMYGMGYPRSNANFVTISTSWTQNESVLGRELHACIDDIIRGRATNLVLGMQGSLGATLNCVLSQ